MERLISRLNELLDLMTREDFKYFNRVKSPNSVLLMYLNELKTKVDSDEAQRIEKFMSFLRIYSDFPIEKRKLLIGKLYDEVKSIKVVEKGKDENKLILNNRAFEPLSPYPLDFFLRPIESFKFKKTSLKVFSKLGLKTLFDVLFYLPFRYEDRASLTPIRGLKPGEKALVKGKIVKVAEVETFRRKKKLLKAVIYDKTGSLTVVFFQRKVFAFYKALLSKAHELNRDVLLYGSVKYSSGGFSMVHPEIEVLDPYMNKDYRLGTIVPIYHLTENINGSTLRRNIKNIVETYAPHFPDYMPGSIIKKHNLIGLSEALWKVHIPGNEDVGNLNSFKSPAQRRLIFDELFLFQLALSIRKKELKANTGIAFDIKNEWLDVFEKMLPFKLTTAQEKVIDEIVNDMKSSKPMNRLVQGDVGSGKTVVAMAASFLSVKSNHQVAVMAPTEILARQHFERFKELLNPTGINVAILTGSSTKKERDKVYSGILDGTIDIVVGTHAIIQDKVRFKNLGLCIVDEQHRFGVLQRAALKGKGQFPDTLVMSATPIPRTLAMTVYGDLDISTIDVLPSGRKPVRTRVVHESERESLVKFLRKELKSGNRIYITYPLIEESEKLELKAATTMHGYWQSKLKGFNVGLLHGRMKQDEKEKVMQDFKNGEYQVLVSTTVIEVGIDVPEATVMVIEEPERFGLAQLHQLRGRVGRGRSQSYCFLATPKGISEDAMKRLKVLESTNDGFKIAEADLKLRGSGEIFGTKQSGIGDFRIADVARDFDILKLSNREANSSIENVEDLEKLKKLITLRFGNRLSLGETG